MSSKSLLNKKEVEFNDKLTILIPTLGEYRQKDLRDEYDRLMNMFIVTPSNKMVELADKGLDFTKITEYEFFLQLFYSEFVYAPQHKQPYLNSKLIFKDLDFTKCNLIEMNNQIVIVNENNELLINEMIYRRLSSFFCDMLNTKKYIRKPGDESARLFIIECERRHLKHRKPESRNIFDELIVGLVCEPGFPYDFDSINKLTLYDFYVCVRQIVKRVNYNNIMNGIYSGFGTVDLKKIKESSLNFLSYRD